MQPLPIHPWLNPYSSMAHSILQTSGLICIFSLKNPSHPEFTFTTDSGVMALHFHPEYANLLAVGCYDGSVLVYDVHTGLDEPIYRATVQTGKHQDPVWQVFWQVGGGQGDEIS